MNEFDLATQPQTAFIVCIDTIVANTLVIERPGYRTLVVDGMEELMSGPANPCRAHAPDIKGGSASQHLARLALS